MNIKKKFFEYDDINRNINYFNYNNDITKDMRIGDNTKISNNIINISQNKNIKYENKIDDYFNTLYTNTTINYDNTKKKNLNYSNYLNPSNMSNSGF